ncbi:hypothetical protein [Oryzobacter telluris]|uniref:hypothetical protein n=1 Tax=Oryzobacter telluris TaxID=3149179 RepID=UPI00370D750A
MGTIVIPGAEVLVPRGRSNSMDGIGGPRATCHATVSKPGSFDAMHEVLTDKKGESHVLYDMDGDRLGQYFPLDRGARALLGSDDTPSGISHNRRGVVNIQVEICWDPEDGDLTAHELWKRPRPMWDAFLDAVRSWGIEDRFIFRGARNPDDRANVVRSLSTFKTAAGGGVWWHHGHYPDGESHWDAGPITESRFFSSEDHMEPRDVWTFDGIIPPNPTPENPTFTAASALQFALKRSSEAAKSSAAAVAQLEAITQQLAELNLKLDALALPGRGRGRGGDGGGDI